MNLESQTSEGSREGPVAFKERTRIGPLCAVATTPEEAARTICELAAQRREKGIHVHLINAFTVALSDKSPTYAEVFGEGSVNLPDGKPLSWVSWIRRDAVRLVQVRGPQLFLNTFDTGRETNIKHFLLGSTEYVLESLTENLERSYPGVDIVGSYSPPFRTLDEYELRAQDEAIRASGADVVWVGLGTPKQDYEARRLADSLPVIAVAVGAAFDFAAGTAREAPPILKTLGLEWLFRLVQEPRRLWRRYLFGNARFLLAATRPRRSRKGLTDFE